MSFETEKITGREYMAQLDNQINEIETRLFKNRSYISMALEKMIQYHKDRFVQLLLERHDLQKQIKQPAEPVGLPYLGKLAMPVIPAELSAAIQGGVDASAGQAHPGRRPDVRRASLS